MNTYDIQLPTATHVMLLQQALQHQAPAEITSLRSSAFSLYEKAIFDAREYTAPLLDISWDSIMLSDFYVPTTRLDQGAFLCDIRDFVRFYPTLAQKYLGTTMPKSWHTRKLIALIEACYNRGAVLYIPPHVSITNTLDIQQLLGGYRHTLLLEKLVIIVDIHASVMLDDSLSHCSVTTPTIMRSIEYHLERQATVHSSQIPERPVDACDILNVSFFCSAGSNLDYTVVMPDSAVSHQWLDVHLQGAHAQATIKGAYALIGKQRSTIASQQLHQAAYTTSELILKGAVAGSAYADYKGIIKIGETAEYANATQTNHTLLLSDHARARAIPSLEVSTHEVQCAHGSAVGALDGQQLWYMQARGLTHAQAKKIIIKGFFQEVIKDNELLVHTLVEKVL